MAQERAPWERPAPTIKERATEAGIEQSGASAASSVASANRTEAITPVDIARTTSQTVTEEQTRPAVVRKGEAEADIAETRAAQMQMALEKARKAAGARPQGADLQQAENELLRVIKAAVQAKGLSRDMFGATGLGSATTGYIGGTPSADVAALLDTIGGNIAFKALSDMRKASPTGGALGAITEKELAMLKSTIAPISQNMTDERFQNGINEVISAYIDAYTKIGGDPFILAGALGPDNIEQFADKIQSWRPLPEDAAAITSYVNQSRKDGTFSAGDYASYMAEAYARATGREPDAEFVQRAMGEGESVQQQEGDIGAFSFDQADEDTRKKAMEYAGAAATETGFGEAIGGALINLPESTLDLVTDTVGALTVNLPETIEGIVGVIGGATGLSDDASSYEALKQYYTDRYGSAEGFKYALKTDPAAILADVAGLVTGGATLAAKGANVASKVTKIRALADAARGAENFAAAAARFDPFTRGVQMGVKGAKAIGSGATSLAANIPAKLAGVTGAEVRQAFSAGQRQSPEFLAQMNQTADVAHPVEMMQGAIGDLYQARSADYQRRMARIGKDEQVLFDDVDAAIGKVRSVGRHKGIDISAAAGAWDEVDGMVQQFRDQGLDTVEDFDAMKRAVGSIRDKYQRGTPEYKTANDVYRAINDTIVAKAPVYANIMGDYRAASDALSDIQSSLSSNANSLDTVLTRLRRTATGRGPRGRTVLDILEQTPSGKGLGDAVAGMAMAGTEPVGIGSSLAPMAAATTGSPEILAAMTATPRGVGQKAYDLGNIVGGVQRGVGAVRGTAPVAAAETAMADLLSKYGDPAAQMLRVANPALIQPQVDPSALPQDVRNAIEQDPSALAAMREQLGGYAGMPSAEGTPATSLAALQQRYGAATPPAGSSLDQLAQQYATPPEAKAAQPQVITVGDRQVQYDPATDEYVDLATGERAADLEGFSAPFKRGGRVAIPKLLSQPTARINRTKVR